MNQIKPGQVVLIAALPLPMEGISELHRITERLYGTGDSMLDFSDERSVRVIAPADGFGPPKRRRPTALAVKDDSRVRRLKIHDDALEITLEEAADVVLALGSAMKMWFELNGGINYVTAQVLNKDDDESPFTLMVQKTGNPTAHDLRDTAEARVALLERQLRDLGQEPLA